MPYKKYSSTNPIRQNKNPNSFKIGDPFYCPQNTAGFNTIDFAAAPLQTLANYCPQNTTEFNTIDYTITPAQTLVNYCPQTTTGFNTINYTITPAQTLVNYCPQTITGFYDLAYDPANPPTGATTHYKVEYNNLLSEIQLGIEPSPDTRLLLDASNNITFTRLSAAPTYAVGALNDNVVSTSNDQYIGTIGGTSSYQIVFNGNVTVTKVYIAPQASAQNLYNLPSYIELYYSLNSGSSWILIQQWTPSFTSGYNTLTVTNSYP